MREADGGESRVERCREKNGSEQTFHRWKSKFGLREIPEARRLKELAKENPELKKMLANSRLKNRGLEIVNAKKRVSQGHKKQMATLVGGDGGVLRAGGVPVSRARPVPGSLSGAPAM